MKDQLIEIPAILPLISQMPIFDVRSPSEYAHAHIPGAYSLPIFTDDERAIIGTTYKIQGKQKAIKYGLDYFGHRMRKMVEEVESLLRKQGYKEKSIIVHCWRGGMRSEAVAWLLQLYGYEVMRIDGGYKSYRNWVLRQFEKKYTLQILGGYTGSGKTSVLQELKNKQQAVIDLEAIANHRGSAFGGIGMSAQPTQEMFENLLALELHQKQTDAIWLEDESQRIGNLNIPNALWLQIRQSHIYFLNIPFEERLQQILVDYGQLPQESLINSVLRIQKKFGPNETKITIQHLVENNREEAFRLLLAYYDKQYKKSLLQREGINELLTEIIADTTYPEANATAVISNLQHG